MVLISLANICSSSRVTPTPPDVRHLDVFFSSKFRVEPLIVSYVCAGLRILRNEPDALWPHAVGHTVVPGTLNLLTHFVIIFHLIFSFVHIFISYLISFMWGNRIVSYRIVLYRIVSYRVVSYHIVSYRIVSYRIVSYRTISYHIILYRVVSYRYVCVNVSSSLQTEIYVFTVWAVAILCSDFQ